MKASILANSTPDKLWFSPFLFKNPRAEDQTLLAQLTVYLHGFQRRQELEHESVLRLIEGARNNSYQLMSKATHVVQQVTYGLNVVMVFEKSVSSMSEKKTVEGKMYLEAKQLFDSITDEKKSVDISVLESASWQIYSDIQLSFVTGVNRLSDLVGQLRQILRCSDRTGCIPVDMTIVGVESGPKFRDVAPDALTQLWMLKSSLTQVNVRCQQLMKNPLLSKIPHFTKRTEEFHRLISALSQKISVCASQTVVNYRRLMGSLDSMTEFWNAFFSTGVLLDYVLAREQELAVLGFLLEGINLPFKALEHLEVEYGGTDCQVEIFVLKTKMIVDPVMTQLKREMNLPEETVFWTTFEIASSSITHHEVQSLRERLLSFREANRGVLCFLSTTDFKQDGSLVSWNRPLDGGRNSPQPFQIPARSTDAVTSKPTPDLLPRPRFAIAAAKETETPAASDGGMTYFPIENEKVDVNFSNCYDHLYDKTESSDIRPAEAFARSSTLLEEGDPSIYLLTFDERTTPDKKLRWFEIGKPMEGGGEKKKPKVLMLIGAANSDKNMLLNSLVNYYLGVEQTDIFRFRIDVDGTETSTSSVTAYSIHHIEGVKLDYGLTIVDVPEVGQEETIRIFSRFLNHPQTRIRLDHVNGIFCVISSDCTPMPVQQILESAFSLLSRNVTNHLHVVCNSSTGAESLILDFIQTASIPTLRDRAIKFNCSSLYAGKQEDCDEAAAAWASLEDSCQKVFSVLDELPACSLQKTKLVLNYRLTLEQTVKTIESQLDSAWEKVESIQQLQQVVAQLEHKMLTCRDFEMEEVRWVSVKTPCSWMAPSAFNCLTCRQTCGKHDFGAVLNVLQNAGMLCPTCRCPVSAHQDQNFRWRLRQERFRTVNQEKKDEYEVTSGRRMTAQAALDQSQAEFVSAQREILAQVEKMAAYLRALESSALVYDDSKSDSLRSYIHQMKSRAESENRPGHAVRSRILDELLWIVMASTTPSEAARY